MLERANDVASWTIRRPAVFANFVTNFGQFVVNLLAVAGGAAVGGWLTGWVVARLCQTFFMRVPPRPALIALRGLGAVAGGLLVAFFVFNGTGIWGLGGGSASGGIGKSESESTANAKEAEPKVAPKIESEPPRAERVRVQMLGGVRVQKLAYYRIEGQSAAQTLEELQRTIRAHKPSPTGVTILIYEDSLAQNSAPVRELEDWARGQGFAVDIEQLPRVLPP